MEETKLNDQSITDIDKAVNAAAARKAAKAAKAPTTTDAAAPAKPKLTPEERAARVQARAEEAAAKKAERDAARAAKKAEQEANRTVPHLSKVNRAAEKLGAMSESATLLFNEATANLTAADITVLAAHLNHHNRAAATVLATEANVNVGDTVRITGGDPRFIGQEGTITRSARIRCYVDVGAEKPVYAFSSDVMVLQAAPVAEAASA
jgi:hypothetical protein